MYMYLFIQNYMYELPEGFVRLCFSLLEAERKKPFVSLNSENNKK